MTSQNEISKKLIEKGLKVTPQRMAILGAILKLNNHPTADQILDEIRKENPHISPATVYHVLDAFVAHGIVNTVKTDRDVKRYEAVKEDHHHIYYADSDVIVDYVDDELTRLIGQYFERKQIPGLKIEDIRLQIIGRSSKQD